VQATGHELLLEIIPPKSLPRASDTVYRALKRLYNLNIFPEWWKLEPMDEAQWHAIDALIAERDPYCRGVVLLGQAAGIDTLAKGFRDARGSATCRGFAVGRTVFQEPSVRWLAGAIDDAAVKQAIRANFEALIDAWQEARAPLTTATSWDECRAPTLQPR
jgi:5-dehydro-2-deoxygluconokinase